MTIESRCIDTIRCLSMDAIQKANSGHPGAPMGLAPAGYVLWTQVLRHSPSNPNWINRDRFVLSCGHASMLLYSLLYLSDYGLQLDDIRNFRQLGSKTPGHPELGPTLGIETTTGPLGQGIGNAVGMAIAERWLANKFNQPNHKIIDHRTLVFAGDGDLMEGLAMEAASLAGHLGLEKLIVLWDDNRITIEGGTELAISEDIKARHEAQGWRVLEADGNDIETISNAFRVAKEPCGKPTLIACKTIIGFPSPNKKNSEASHGAPLGKDEVKATKLAMGWDPEADFFVPEEVLDEFKKCKQRGTELEAAWNVEFESYRTNFPQLAAELASVLKGDLGSAWEVALPSFKAGDNLATREASGRILNTVAAHVQQLMGGSSDLGPSNNTIIKGGGEFNKTESGRNFHFGVREHAMGAIMNGMCIHGGPRCYGGTFLVFCDYMRPSIRMAALMKLPVIYVFTHDSIGVGEDGPTHQPIEQIMSMRMIPGLVVIRPADATETIAAWNAALKKTNGPTALILSRQKLPVLDAGKTANARRGGYILEEPTTSSAPQVILAATGSEVHVALKAHRTLEVQGISARVVSLPSWEIFEEQDTAYRQSVFPPDIPVVSIEAGVTLGWQRYADASIGIDQFGASAPAEVLFEKFGITADRLANAANHLLASNPK
ncbi:MAG: transketolase [Holophagales bacterium]|nr:transketolase [Holophagales bacterium]